MKFALCLVTATAAAGNEDGTSLMQRRFVKQMNVKDSSDETGTPREHFKDWIQKKLEAAKDLWEGDHEKVYDTSPVIGTHICGHWSPWSECNAQCGGGFESRTYTFDEGAKCGESCPHGDGAVQQRECQIVPCPVACEGNWGEYKPCSTTCGGGTKSRQFIVTQEALHGGEACPKTHGTVEDAECSMDKCETNCLGHWDDWTECSNGGAGPHGMECGPGGTQSRNYNVTVEHTSGGCACLAGMVADPSAEVEVDTNTVDTRECELDCCPEPCEGSWGEWSKCSGPKMQMQAPVMAPAGYMPYPPGYAGPQAPMASAELEMCCGGGRKERKFLVSKDLVCGGTACTATNGLVDTDTCCEAPCPVDCEGEWGEPGECCSSCGGGQHERVFMITQEAMHGGKQCDHKEGDIKHETCNEDVPCPIHCEGEWSPWDTCTDSCGPDGTQTSHYHVTVEAEHGGMLCSLVDQVKLQSCDPEPKPCPIDAECKWTPYSMCSATCQDTQNPVPIIKTRTWFTVKAAQFGGKECEDSPPEYQTPEANCHMPNCPIACEGHWSEFSTCNAKIASDMSTGGCGGDHLCGGGTKFKTWIIDQVALYGGEQCPYEDGHKQSKLCGEYPCPIDCEGAFDEWGSCTAACGGASQARQYVIKTPAQHGGCECEHVEHVEHQECNTHPCPIDCEGSWGEWGACSQKCTDCRNSGDHGLSERKFKVSVPDQHGGAKCPHADGEVEKRDCNEDCCAEDCEGSWSEFGDCSSTCGSGMTMRKYTITHEEKYGGVPCPYCADAEHTTACNHGPCPIDCVGEYEPWAECDARCGGGYTWTYYKQTQTAQHGGKDCPHEQWEFAEKDCNTEPCPLRCLGAFGPWSTCDATCSPGGKKTRTFKVHRAASGGGPPCRFAEGDVDEQVCNADKLCPAGYVCPPQKSCAYANGLIQIR